MKKNMTGLVGSLMFVAAGLAGATGLATRKSSDESGWQSQDALKKKLGDKG